jgi:hypothetical protein
VKEGIALLGRGLCHPEWSEGSLRRVAIVVIPNGVRDLRALSRVKAWIFLTAFGMTKPPG